MSNEMVMEMLSMRFRDIFRSFAKLWKNFMFFILYRPLENSVMNSIMYFCCLVVPLPRMSTDLEHETIERSQESQKQRQKQMKSEIASCGTSPMHST